MLRTCSQIEVRHIATVHTLLDGEVDNRLLLTILNTRDTRLVALLVVELHVLDNVDGDVLQGCFYVAKHKLLAIKQNLLHRFAIDGDITVLIDLGTGDALDEFLDRRTLGRTVGIWIIDQRILFDNDLCGTTCHNSFFQQDGLRRHEQHTHILTLVTT